MTKKEINNKWSQEATQTAKAVYDALFKDDFSYTISNPPNTTLKRFRAISPLDKSQDELRSIIEDFYLHDDQVRGFLKNIKNKTALKSLLNEWVKKSKHAAEAKRGGKDFEAVGLGWAVLEILYGDKDEA